MIKYYFFGLMKYLTSTEHRRLKTHLIVILSILFCVEGPYFIGLMVAEPNMVIPQVWLLGLGLLLLFLLSASSIVWIYIRLYILIKDELKRHGNR